MTESRESREPTRSPRPAGPRKPNTKPVVAVAAVCENVLRDQDDVISAIRIIDILAVDIPNDINGKPATQARILIVLKSVDFVGRCVVRVDLRAPAGTSARGEDIEANFLGQNHGLNLNVQAGIVIDGWGVYYFDVFCDDEVLTTIPLRIVPAAEFETEKQRYRSGRGE